MASLWAERPLFQPTGCCVVVALGVACLTALVLHLTRSYSSRLSLPEPPVVSGWPILGNAVQLMRGRGRFIRECCVKYGDVFALQLPGQRMVFLQNSDALEYFFTSPESLVTFTPAVEQFTGRVFGLPQKDFLGKHDLMLQSLHNQLVPGTLDLVLRPLLASLSLRLQSVSLGPEGCDLWQLVKNLTFRSSVDALFGPQFLKRLDANALHHTFWQFEVGFEMAASPLPHALQPTFRRARASLLAAFRRGLDEGMFEGSLVGNMVSQVGLADAYVPNMLLAFLWASQANAIPTAFWAVAFLLLPENARHRRDVELELGGTSNGTLSGADLIAADERLLRLATDPSSLLRRCCAEAIRLRSMSVTVRVAAADAVLQLSGGAMLLRRGSVLALSAYDLHADPRLFGETAESYDPGREAMLLRGKPCRLHSVVVGVGGGTGLPFGGGKFRCPGRYLAEAEVSLVLGKLLRAWPGLRLGSGPQWAGGMGDPAGRLPPPDLTKMVGMKVPVSPCMVVA